MGRDRTYKPVRRPAAPTPDHVIEAPEPILTEAVAVPSVGRIGGLTQQVPAVRRSAAPTLTVGAVNDPFEAAADRAADTALSRIRRDGPMPSAGGGSTSAPSGPVLVGREGGPTDQETHNSINAMRGRGAPLPAPVRERMEGAFGADLGAVRIHTDQRAAGLSHSLSAKAFTVGRDMFFGAGSFRPDTPDGEHTLAHEIAHTVQAGGAVQRIQRAYDLREKQPLGLDTTTSIKTVGDRQVWFFGSADDTVVVKLEDQPLGLNQLATFVHATVTKASTVRSRKLISADRTQVRGMIEAGRLTGGEGWRKATSNEVPKDRFNGDLDAWGRAVHVAAIDAKPNDPMIAMTVASGESARKLEDSSLAYGQDGMAPIRRVLTEPKLLRQLGELSAVDLFLGNRDRVLSGNLGNWFYTPAREMTVIDNVDAQMTKYLTGVGEEPKAADPLAMLARGALAATTKELINGMVAAIRAGESMMKTFTYAAQSTGGGKTYVAGDKEKQKEWDAWVKANRSTMQSEVLAGLVAGRKRIIKTMTSSKFTNRGKRGDKKAIKAHAAMATHRDQNHSQTDYYALLKGRAKWLADN